MTLELEKGVQDLPFHQEMGYFNFLLQLEFSTKNESQTGQTFRVHQINGNMKLRSESMEVVEVEKAQQEIVIEICYRAVLIIIIYI